MCLALAVLPASAEAPPAAHTNQLTLSATASIDVTRDLLAITFSTQREGADAAAVQSQLAQALEPALAEARKIARPGQVEVSSGNFAVFPRYAPKGGATTWQGTAELRVEGRDVDSITRLVGRIQTMSVARVGYSLSREARDKVQAEVSAQAIARFRSQAEAYARAFGFGCHHAARGGTEHERIVDSADADVSRGSGRRADGRRSPAGRSRQGQRHAPRSAAACR